MFIAISTSNTNTMMEIYNNMINLMKHETELVFYDLKFKKW